MTRMREEGEPIANGRRDRSAAERQAMSKLLLFAAVLGGVVLINALLWIAMIALVEAVGLWDSGAAMAQSLEDFARSRRWAST